MQQNKPKESFLLKLKNYFFSTPEWIKEARKRVPELTAEFQATESDEAAKEACISYLKEKSEKETATTIAERAVSYFDTNPEEKFTSRGVRQEKAEDIFSRDFQAFVHAYVNNESFNSATDKVRCLTTIIGTDAIEGDAKDRPYEHLLKRTEGEPVSEEYKKQCLILAAFSHESMTPYRYNIIVSNREKPE